MIMKHQSSTSWTPLKKIYLLLLVVTLLLAACSIGQEAGSQNKSSTPAEVSSVPSPSPAASSSQNPPPSPTATHISNSSSSSANANQNKHTNIPQFIRQEGDLSIPEVVHMVKPSVVEIIACEFENCSRGSSGTGSGFIIDKEGHIVTNNHVVEGARRVTAILYDGRIREAKVVGTDPLTDVALIKINDNNLQPAKLGDSSKAQVGETVVAIGSALGLMGDPTVTVGVISALDRAQEEPSTDPTQPGTNLYGLIQTDAAVNPGNSGGPLLNLKGEVIGINTLGARLTEGGVPVQGINFAVSINTAKDVVQEILQKGRVTYPYIGICTTFIYPEDVVRQNLPNVRGQLITPCAPGVPGVRPGTPAARAGLQEGDIIVAIDNHKISNESDFVRILREHEPGDRITLTIERNGKKIQKELVLAERPSNS